MLKTYKPKYLLKFTNPTNVFSPWQSALPCGNGITSCLIQGGARYDKIMLGSNLSFWGGKVGVLPDVSDKLKNIRKLATQKNPTQAGIDFENSFKTKKYTPTSSCPLPICDICVTQEIGNKPITNYSRNINMENGEVSIQFTDCNVKVDRSVFVSKQNDLVFYEINKIGTKPLKIDLSITGHDLRTSIYNGVSDLKINKVTNYIENGYMFYGAEFDGGAVGAVARLILDSKSVYTIVDNTIKIDNAEKILLIVKTFVSRSIAKSFVECKSTLSILKNLNYEKQLKEHIDIYLKEWGKSELYLTDLASDISVEQLLKNTNQHLDVLSEKLFDYAKYLLITGTSDGNSFPMLTTGPWSFHYNNKNAMPDFSCTMPALYSFCFASNQESKFDAVIKYFETYLDDFKKNASRVYKSNGLMIPNRPNNDVGIIANISSTELSTIIAGAVFANLLYEYFLYTKDIKLFRSKIMNYMKDIANFYINYFYADNRNSCISCPSFSPYGRTKLYENKQEKMCINSYCDFIIVKNLIQNIIDACNDYSLPLSEIMEYQDFLNSMPNLDFNGDEYLCDDNSYKSAGFLHLYDVFGSNVVNRNSSTIITSYLNVIAKKISESIFYQNSLSLSRVCEISAKLGQTKAFENILTYTLNNYISNNLLYYMYDKNNMNAVVEKENYFNVGANQVLANSILSSLLSESKNNIFIFNAKPKCYKSGKLTNIMTKQNVVVDVSFDDKKGYMEFKAKALRTTCFNVVLPPSTEKVKNYEFDPASKTLSNLELQAGRTLILEIKY